MMEILCSVWECSLSHTLASIVSNYVLVITSSQLRDGISVVLICISLLTTEAEQLAIDPLAIFISSLGKCLFGSIK